MITYTGHNQTGRGYYDDQHSDYYGDYHHDVSTYCKNYAPRGRASVMNMENYTTCDYCCHLRADNRCGLAQQTLS